MDPTTQRMLAEAARIAERETEQQQRALDNAGGAAMALANLPVSERIDLIGALSAGVLDGGTAVSITIAGPGTGRSYTMVIPTEWLTAVLEAASKASAGVAESPPPVATPAPA